LPAPLAACVNAEEKFVFGASVNVTVAVVMPLPPIE